MSWQLRWMGLTLVSIASVPAHAQFTEVASSAGVAARAAKDGGATFAFIDGDEFLDLFVHGNSSSFLFISDGGSPPTFDNQAMLRAPELAASGEERAAIVADLTGDGYPELIRGDNDDLQIFVNSGPPDFTFTLALALDTTSDPDLNVEGTAAGDFDGDGWLELFIESTGPQIYDNPEDGTVALLRLPPAMTGLPDGRAMSTNGGYVAAVDFDVDGDIDLGYRDETLPTLYTNDGDGSFTAIATPNLDPDSKGGIRFCDFDNNGYFDFFFSGGSGGGRNRIWLQDEDGTFSEAADPAPAGSVLDSACADVDNDGDLDLYLARRGEDDLLLNQLTESGTMSFTDAGMTGAPLNSECPVFADYDNDGDVDLYVNYTGDIFQDTTVMPPRTVRESADNRLYQNGTNGTDYLIVEVRTGAAPGCPAALRPDIGAVASLSLPSAGWQSGVRDINGGQGHGSQGSPRIHFGLPNSADETYELTVRFAANVYPETTLSVTPASLGAYQRLVVDATDIDGDGILTAHEVADAGAVPDLDGDGLPAWNDPDSDGDGIPDAMEAGDTDLCTEPVDADGSGVRDYLEGPDPVGDASVGDASTDTGVGLPDGSAPDVGFDAGGSSLQVHGSGCVQCAASGADDGRTTAAFFALTGLLLVARRRRSR